MFTKNLAGPEYHKHPAKMCRNDEYYIPAQDAESLISSKLICRIKVGNDHGLVAHSAQVPLCSTQLLISKLEIMIVASIKLSAVLESSHVTINQKDHFFGHVLSPPWYLNAFLYHM